MFCVVETLDSEIFRGKYGERIAKHAGSSVRSCISAERQMAWDTPEDRTAVWDSTPELLRSFSHALTNCKAGRWFSWNESADENLGEFWPAKMVLEHHLGDVPDPDAEAIGFDDLVEAAKAKTPQAQLAALRKSGGGLSLAYRLMTTGLWQNAKIL